MNILHLRYALEVARAGSISQAAENLYMGQPNLSKAIKELEQSLNITIFTRTSKGAEVTPKGREFLRYAQNILRQYDAMEALGREGDAMAQRIRVTIPRASYMVDAFTNFLSRLDPGRSVDADLMETNTMRSIRHVADGRADFGAIRYKAEYAGYFEAMLAENELESQSLLQAEYLLLVSRSSPLAQMEEVPSEFLSSFTELVHGDSSVPGAMSENTDTERGKTPGDKKVYLYERGSLYDILARVPGTFMWVAPTPKDVLKRNGLVQKRSDISPTFQDSLIYQKGHEFSQLEEMYVREIKKSLEKTVKLMTEL